MQFLKCRTHASVVLYILVSSSSRRVYLPYVAMQIRSAVLFFSALCTLASMRSTVSYQLRKRCSSRLSRGLSVRAGPSDPPSMSTSKIPKIVSIALTREKESNRELGDLLKLKLPGPQFRICAVPCISFADGPDCSRLTSALTAADAVVITSPRVISLIVS